jgi:hypothetical protein
MRYLSEEIEKLLKQKNQESLIRKQYSCGIFQEYGPTGMQEQHHKSQH